MNAPLLPTPAALGFRMPAEWEPHESIWLSWPHNAETWPGHFEEIPAIFAEIVRLLTSSGLVRINVSDDQMAEEARRLLGEKGADLNQVRFHRHPTNDSWVRDHGPIYVVRQQSSQRQRAIIDWDYNAWGGKYPPFDLDDAVPRGIAEEFHEQRFVPHMVLEGGSIDVNGKGTLLTSEACLLHSNRNPDLSREEIEQRLKDYLGITRILWLGEGIAGDDTDGHIDDMTRFVAPSKVVTCLEQDRTDENYHPLRENWKRLRRMTDQDGRPLQIVPLPMPEPIFCNGQRLPASYANFLITNRIVLMPWYDDTRDRQAQDLLQSLFPDRQVIGVDCRQLVWGRGAIHCLTQQQPLGTPWPRSGERSPTHQGFAEIQ